MGRGSALLAACGRPVGADEPAEHRGRRRRRRHSPAPRRRRSPGRSPRSMRPRSSGISASASVTSRRRRSAPRSTASGALRPFLDHLYRPAPSVLAPAEDEVIVCRCEEVPAGRIRQAARLGAQGPNQLKAFTRCGDGALPGPDLRTRCRRADRRCAWQTHRRNRHLPAARPVQADHRRRPRRSPDLEPGCPATRRPTPWPPPGSAEPPGERCRRDARNCPTGSCAAARR